MKKGGGGGWAGGKANNWSGIIAGLANGKQNLTGMERSCRRKTYSLHKEPIGCLSLPELNQTPPMLKQTRGFLINQ